MLPYLQAPVGNRTGFAENSGTAMGFDLLQQWSSTWYACGTAALAAAVQYACDVSSVEQPKVLLAAYGCPDLVAAIRHAGAEPCFVDVNPDSLQWSEDAVRRALDETSGIVAVIAVDLFGIAENLDVVSELCAQQDVVVIRDCAQSLQSAALIDAEAHAELMVFSFGRGKPVYLQGGGALLKRVNGKDYAALASIERSRVVSDATYSAARNHAYNTVLEPHVYAVVAALLGNRIGATRYEPLAEIKLAPSGFGARANAAIAHYWQQDQRMQNSIVGIVKEVAQQSGGLLSLLSGDDDSARRLLRVPVLLKDRALRDEWLRLLHKAGIGATDMYSKALPDIEGVNDGAMVASYGNAKQLADRLLTLPAHARMTGKDVAAIASSFESLVSGRSGLKAETVRQ